MEQKEKEEGNLLIAQFEGYVYYESGIWVDYADMCGGFSGQQEVFSKVPIEIKEYNGDKYFKDMPNPDFGNKGSKRWRDDLETLGWDTLNRADLNYVTELKYDSDWNELMRIVEKIAFLPEDIKIVFGNINTYCQVEMLHEKFTNLSPRPIEATWKTVVEFIKWYNENKDSDEG